MMKADRRRDEIIRRLFPAVLSRVEKEDLQGASLDEKLSIISISQMKLDYYNPAIDTGGTERNSMNHRTCEEKSDVYFPSETASIQNIATSTYSDSVFLCISEANTSGTFVDGSYEKCTRYLQELEFCNADGALQHIGWNSKVNEETEDIENLRVEFRKRWTEEEINARTLCQSIINSAKLTQQFSLSFRILVVGESGTGKTSIIKCCMENSRVEIHKPGITSTLKIMPLDKDEHVALQMWDLSGEEQLDILDGAVYQMFSAAMIIFDVSTERTLKETLKWKHLLESSTALECGSPIMLVANKCDLKKDGYIKKPERIRTFSEDNGFCSFLQTSAKENFCIEEAIICLISKMMNRMEFLK